MKVRQIHKRRPRTAFFGYNRHTRYTAKLQRQAAKNEREYRRHENHAARKARALEKAALFYDRYSMPAPTLMKRVVHDEVQVSEADFAAIEARVLAAMGERTRELFFSGGRRLGKSWTLAEIKRALNGKQVSRKGAAKFWFFDEADKIKDTDND